MEPRIDYWDNAPDALKGMMNLEKTVKESELESSLIELVKLRASQINGCAYCIDMHAKDAREDGETEQRLYALNVWEETDFYNDRERAALKWTEALTEISVRHISDELYESVREHFSKDEMIILTLSIVAINGWNRLAIGFGTVPGSYKPELAN